MEALLTNAIIGWALARLEFLLVIRCPSTLAGNLHDATFWHPTTAFPKNGLVCTLWLMSLVSGVPDDHSDITLGAGGSRASGPAEANGVPKKSVQEMVDLYINF